MKRAVLPSLLVVAACAADPDGDPALAPDAQAPAAPVAVLGPLGSPFQPGELIVKLRTPIDGTSTVTVAGQRLRPIRRKPSGAWLMELDDPHRRAAGQTALEHATLDALAALTADPDVEYAQENGLVEFSFTPNDELFDRQWQFQRSRMPLAWDLTRGSSLVRIAIIDKGNRPHPDLDGRWDPGFDFVDNDDVPTQPIAAGDWPHGMHVAGIAGGTGNDATTRDDGGGIAGVCWNCRLIALRIEDWDDVEAAITWVANGGSRRAEVINLSINQNGTASQAPSCDDQSDVRDAINAAATAGVSVVAAVGNRGFNSARFPANCTNVIGVAASDRNNVIAQYSNRGPGTDLTAPAGGGVNETSSGGMFGIGIDCPADPINPTYVGDNGALSSWMVGAVPCYRYLSGTSMAAPHVAGVVALMRSIHPALTPAQIEQILRTTASTTALFCPNGGCGGLLDARAALDAVQALLSPELVVSPLAVGFGNVQVGTSATPRPVTISNVGPGVLNFSVSAPGFPLECGGPCSGSLPSNQSRTVTVGFAPWTAGEYSGSLKITSNDADENPTYVSLTGAGITPLMDTPPLSLDFGSVAVGATSAAQVVTVLNSSIATMALNFSVASSSSEFPITCAGGCSGTLAPGQTRDVSITFVPAAADARTGVLTFTSNDLARPTLTTQLSGNGLVPRVNVGPVGFSFGNVQYGHAISQDLIIMNTGQLPVTYEATIAGAASFTLTCDPCSGTLAVGQTRNIPVRFAPLTQGSQSATIRVATNDPSRPMINKAAQGKGTMPQIYVNRTSLEFGNVEVAGGVATQAFTIVSSGQAPLDASAALDSPDFSLACVAGCGWLGWPGASRTYLVTFDPTTAGVRTGTAVVTSNDPTRPTVAIALRGTGVAPAIAVTPGGLAFGAGVVGEPLTQTVSVKNGGTAPLVLASVAPPPGFAVGGTYPSTIAPGATLSVAVTCTRAAAGTAAGNLVLAHNAGLATSVALTCATYAARLVVEQPTSALWLIPGGSAPVQVRNTGPGSITITGVGFSGEPGSWFVAATPPLPVTLAAGQSLSWMVTCPAPRFGWNNEKHHVMHDGLDPGSISANCSSLVDEIPEPPGFPYDPPPVEQ